MKIVRTRPYERDLKRLRLTAEEIATLEGAIAAEPEAGDLISGSGGVRKLRFAMAGRGKSGGGRAIYYVIVADDVAVMLTAYAKNEREDLIQEEIRRLRALVKELKRGRR